MWVQFIKVYNESCNVLLAVPVTHERIYILLPAFNVTFPFDTGIVRSFLLEKPEILRPMRRIRYIVPMG